MRRHFISGLMLLAAAAGLQAETGFTQCSQNTLANYETTYNSDHQCEIGILLFQNFSLLESGTSTNLEPATNIILTPIADTADNGGGFNISSVDGNGTPVPFTVAAGLTANYVIDWSFFIDPGPISAGADLGMDPPSGNVTITQEYCLDSTFTATNDGDGTTTDACTDGAGLQSQQVMVDTLGVAADQSSHLDFNPVANNFGNVRTIINLVGNVGGVNTPSGFDASPSSQEAQMTSTTPEPFSAALAGGGLLLIVARRRRLKLLS